MFTALLLMCSSGIKSVDTCYYMGSSTLYETLSECRAEIAEAYTLKENFEFFDEDLEESWKMTDAKCVDWKEVRI